MNPIDLARRAVCSPGWRWMAGMIPISLEPLSGTGDRILPDLTDAETVNCLMSLVEQSWRRPIHLYNCDDGWILEVEYPLANGAFLASSRAGALVEALEMAPFSDPER